MDLYRINDEGEIVLVAKGPDTSLPINPQDPNAFSLDDVFEILFDLPQK